MEGLCITSHEVSTGSNSSEFIIFSLDTENTELQLSINQLGFDIHDSTTHMALNDINNHFNLFEDIIHEQQYVNTSTNTYDNFFEELPNYFPEETNLLGHKSGLHEDPKGEIQAEVFHYRNEDIEPFKQEKWQLKYQCLEPQQISKSIQLTVKGEHNLENEFIKQKSKNFSKKKLKQHKIQKLIQRKKRTNANRLVWEPESIYKAYTNIKTPHLNSKYFDSIPRYSCFGKVNMRCKRAWTRSPTKRKRRH